MTYILTDTRSRALSSGPAKTDNSDYLGGVAVLSLSHDYSVSETPLPAFPVKSSLSFVIATVYPEVYPSDMPPILARLEPSHEYIRPH
jgi:hypothetical protein